jgi:hypothetical protein
MLLIFLLAPSLSPKADFARCVRVLRKSPTYAVRVKSTTISSGQSVTTTAVLAVRSKNWMSLDVSTPAEAGHGALDWVCEFHDRTLRAYDASRRAYIEQSFDKPLPAAAGLAAQFGTMIPDAIQRFMTPDQLSQFLDRFVGLKGWKRSTAGDAFIWKYKNSAGGVQFGFSRESGRLLDWQISGVSITRWKFQYPSLAEVPALRIPADAVLVESFRLPPARPKVADPDARRTVDACFDAYEKAFRLSSILTVDGVSCQIWRDGGMVEEVGPSGGWRWSHGILTLWPKSGGVLSGKTRLSRIRSYLAQLHVDAEPLALAMLSDENFAGKIFTPDYEVKNVGSVTLGGEPLTLLQLTGPAVKIDLSINRDGLIRRIDSSAFDSKGRRMSETVREVTYGPLGTPSPAPQGRILPLPKLEPPPKPPPGFKYHG